MGCLERRYASPLGELLLAAGDGALVGLWFAGQARFRELPGLVLGRQAPGPADAAALDAACRWLDRYFAGREPGPLPPMRLGGSPFRKRVWEALLRIPRGQTRSYGQLAAELGSSARAVGGAVARNPISILVPCHRVLGAKGRLTGYAGGLDKKEQLLALEQGRK